jgi:bla regulator protein BlaR1
MAGGRLAPALGVLLLLSLTQAASGLPRRQSPALPRSGPDAYILSQGENSFSTNCSLEALGAVRERLSGDFLWIRRAGKVYLIRDDRTLDEAHSLFAPLRQLDPEHEALARRQSRLSAEQDALDHEQEEIEQELDRLSDEEENSERASDRLSIERRQRDLEQRVRALQARERELDAVERSIDQREDALEKKIEARLWRLIDESIARGVARPDEIR